MVLSEKVKQLLEEIKALEANPTPDKQLPQNTFYLNENDILCLERERGEHRYPYDSDGLVLWARSSGYIEARESIFSIFRTVNYSEDAPVGFFAGFKKDDGTFLPVSMFSALSNLDEGKDVKRYLVYSFRCAYYITDTKDITFALRLHVDKEKHIHFAYVAINKTNEEKSFYMESSIEALLRFTDFEGFFDRMNKYGNRYDNGSYLLRSNTQCLVINERSIGGTVTEEYHTVAKTDVLGGIGRTLSNSVSLREGKYRKQAKVVNTTDLPLAADLVHYTLKGGESIRREYDLSYYHHIPTAESHIGDEVDIDKIDAELVSSEIEELKSYDSMKITFDSWNGKLNKDVLNKFIRNVQKQVSFCALGKSYAEALIGVRDVMQQLESSLIYAPELSRAKIVNALNYILEDGRPPRQFSVPATDDMIPEMDLRKYIDQGVWVISTVYTYLSYTDDYSILDEECSYYVASDDNTCIVRKSEIRDTVLDHLVKIMDFLASNIDMECGTGCLRVLHGDWNDALCGLGRTKREGREFGSGVTVMATLQYWQNLREMSLILKKVGKHEEKLDLYKKLSDGIEEGLKKYAIDVNEEGKKRIIHGWGDLMSYKIGSWNDPDGVSRLSTTAHAFWALSGMIEKDPSMKDVIMDEINAVSSKYGIKTFDKPFNMDLYDYVGRIATINPGTYENSAAYVHASMFAIMALFTMGESERAWKEMEKSVVISHDNCTRTSFVMPNSYCEAEKFGIDGDSMGDWYTGSGTVLIKSLVKFCFGICPDLSGLCLQMPKTMPADSASIKVSVKGHPITVVYKNEGKGSRSFDINGKAVNGEFSPLMNVEKLYIKSSDIVDGMVITVKD